MLELLFEPNNATNAIWFTIMLMVSLSIVIFQGSKEYSSRVFSILVLFTALWSFFVSLQVATPEKVLSDPRTTFIYETMSRGNEHLLGVLIVILLFYFCLTYMSDKKYPKTIVILLIVWIATSWISFSDLFIDDISKWNWLGHDFLGGNIWQWMPGPYNYLYNAFFFGLPVAGIAVLYRKRQRTEDFHERKRLLFMILTFGLGLPLPSLGSIVLPIYFNIFSFHWLGAFSHILWISIVSYSIMKYNNMNVRIVFAELLILAGSLLLFINIFL